MDQFYLCHPDNRKSCGACCGLYNYENFNREMITAALQFHTEMYKLLKPTGEALEQFRAIIAEADHRPKLLEEIFTCEFLGFLDPEEKRAGCLIHPMAHDGLEIRDHSYYGAEMCHEHRCASYNYLTEESAEPVIAALDDWYLYGLCITDVDIVKGFYDAVSDLRFETVKPRKIVENPKALDAFRRYLELKETWPYHRGRRRFGQYIFERGVYRVSDIDWEKLGLDRPREERILRSMGCDFESAEEAVEALKKVRAIISEAAESF